jgi:hypothetical protein
MTANPADRRSPVSSGPLRKPRNGLSEHRLHETKSALVVNEEAAERQPSRRPALRAVGRGREVEPADEPPSYPRHAWSVDSDGLATGARLATARFAARCDREDGTVHSRHEATGASAPGGAFRARGSCLARTTESPPFGSSPPGRAYERLAAPSSRAFGASCVSGAARLRSESRGRSPVRQGEGVRGRVDPPT